MAPLPISDQAPSEGLRCGSQSLLCHLLWDPKEVGNPCWAVCC